MVKLADIFSANGRSYREREPDPTKHWYALCRTATANGSLRAGGQTEFVDYSKVRPFRERRRASYVKPATWRKSMSDLREVPITVDDKRSMLVWLLLGGEALVESSFARKHFPESLEPHECGRIAGDLGWHSTENMDSTVLRHAPSAKVRVEVLVRDNRRCRLCGRSPDEDTHAFLEAHHGVPWGDRHSGLTVKENLFTFCNSCHKGISNGLEAVSLSAIGVSDFAGADSFRQDYFAEVFNYRKLILQAMRGRANRRGASDGR